MRSFLRQPQPPFWVTFDQKWCDRVVRQQVPSTDPLNQWSHQGRTLATLFHEHVRPPQEPRYCAYCDGPLGKPKLDIDHFLPKALFPLFRLEWDNLFPCCMDCNRNAKGTRWHCAMLRPDTDPVENYFIYDPETGAVRPNDDLDKEERRRARLTIYLLKLNSTDQRIKRRTIFKLQRLDPGQKNGPYRFHR